MATAVSIMSFLRPLGPPRPATIRQFLRFSTSSRCRAAQQAEDHNLVASRTAPATYPPPSMKSLPRPKESHASHRTAHPKKQRHYPTRGATHVQTNVEKLIPEPVEPLAPQLCAPNLPYFVNRTPNNELPIYTLKKRGGNLKLTKVRKVDGRKEILRDELRVALGLAENEAVINQLTGHIVLKGHHKPRIQKFLRERMF